MLAAFLSYLHVMALGLGLGACYMRGQGFRDPINLPRVFAADNVWGIASLLWIGSGIARLYVEKGTWWYLHNPLFHAKMGLLGVALLLETWIMITLIRWRIQEAKGQTLNLKPVRYFRVFNQIELILILIMPLVATAMARGIMPQLE